MELPKTQCVACKFFKENCLFQPHRMKDGVRASAKRCIKCCGLQEKRQLRHAAKSPLAKEKFDGDPGCILPFTKRPWYKKKVGTLANI